MALFPTCGFKVLLQTGVVKPGELLEGSLVLTVPEAIPRAEHVALFFRTTATAGYGSGKNRSVFCREMFVAPMRVDLPSGAPLATGEHRFPFAIDVPSWLPPPFEGSDCSIRHVIETRLDVDWAIDPKAIFVPPILLPPAEAEAAPLTTRSPAGFHESIVVEIILDSSAIAQNEPVWGQIALRGGHRARFDAINIAVVSTGTIRFARGDRRNGTSTTIRIPADRLRGGESVPFGVPPSTTIPPTFRNGFIDHDVFLTVTIDIPWAVDPSFAIPLRVLPPGSVVRRVASAVGAVGTERLYGHAVTMSEGTGLARGALPVLVEGSIGPVGVRVSDGPRSGRLGVDIDFTFPDLDLGIAFRPMGMLDGFRTSPLLPAALGDRYLLRIEQPRERPAIDDAALAAFTATVLGDLGGAAEVRLSDHHMGIHLAVVNDSSEQMLEIARFARARAEAIANAIGALPFSPGHEEARAAWAATAAEQSAALLPHLPALHGLAFHARVLGGETRTMHASIVTEWGSEPRSVVHVDLREAPLPRSAWAELERDPSGTSVAGLRPVRAVFPSLRVETQEKVVLECASFTPDPRALLSAIELFFWWILDVRGERRADAPYR